MLDHQTFNILRTIEQTRKLFTDWRQAGQRIGLVPTMGALHAGHLSLARRAREENERVVVTIFVNPLQFSPTEDLAAYPRDEKRDFDLLREQRCDAVFAPDVRELFPDGSASQEEPATRVSVGPRATLLCGATRPTHFDGVATIVLKLFLIALPNAAYFGEKDYQQLTIVRRMVRDLDVPVRIAGVPIVRELDGLAFSSRNAYLDARQRAIAPALAHELHAVRDGIIAGDAPQIACAAGSARIVAAGFDRVEYLTLAAGDTLKTLTQPQPQARLLAAAWLGRTRLIDNLALLA